MAATTPPPPQSNSNVYAVVLAGGSGQRFWPLSRERKPKQLLRLFDDRTLLEHTIARLEGFVPRQNILILTNHQQLGAVREVLPDFPAENIVAEPEKRDTAPAIALGIGWVAARNPEAVMMVLPSDHLIRDRAGFHRTLAAACDAARNSGALVTIGIKPSWACPSYGYIERGRRIDGLQSPVFEVSRFREKPDTELAANFLGQGNFVWNAGMFFWSVVAVRRDLAAHCPALAAFVDDLAHAKDFSRTLQAHFPSLAKLSIDYALMEQAPRVLNVEADFDWDDVGNWTSVGQHLTKDAAGNQHNCALSQIEAVGNLVFSETGQHVAMLGVSDLIVIATKDALLIAHRGEAERLKKLVDELPEKLR
ncbi:MAG TPA: mannose-1-phosphate guanylyltransferase [Verrucomicrobiaceae bacterium]